MSALLYRILMPLMITLMFGALARLESSERPLEAPVAGRERAPNLVAWLEARGVIVVDPPDDPEAAVRDGDLDLVLIIDEDYGQHFRSVQPATVRLVHDSSRRASSFSIRRARNLLREYSNQMAVLRLIARGVRPALRHAADVPHPGRVRRLTTCLFGLFASVLTLVAFLFMMRFVPLEQLGMQLTLEYRQLLLMTIAVAPMALFASALQMFVATFARSFKEAQTYVSVLILLPMVPGMVMQIYPLQPAGWMMAIPALAQQLLLVDVMGGEPVSTLSLLGSAAATTALAGAFLGLTSRMLRQEKIIFGRT